MAEKHFHEQIKHSREYLIPYFENHIPDFQNKMILEIGCAEGGFLDELHHKGIKAIGVELSKNRVRLAQEKNKDLRILIQDITDDKITHQIKQQFDCIVMRDVIEHISERKKVFKNITELLKPNGYLYISFPPKYSPFAGHQQVGQSLLSKIPWLTLFPKSFIQWIGHLLNEKPHIIENAYQNVKSGLGICQFEKYMIDFGFEFLVKDFFFIRPVYQTRFGFKMKRLPDIPIMREFITMGCECLLQWKGTTIE